MTELPDLPKQDGRTIDEMSWSEICAVAMHYQAGRLTLTADVDIETTTVCRNCDKPAYQHGTLTVCRDLQRATYVRAVTPWTEVVWNAD